MAAVISGGVRKIGIVAPNRIVRACNRTTGALVEETISDQVGNYTFETLDTGTTYYVYALDETFNQYNAAIGDALKPLPLFSFTGSSIGSIVGISSSTATFTLTAAISIAVSIDYGISSANLNITDVSIGGPVSISSSDTTFDFFVGSASYSEVQFDLIDTPSIGILDINSNTSIIINQGTSNSGVVDINSNTSIIINQGNTILGILDINTISDITYVTNAVSDGTTA